MRPVETVSIRMRRDTLDNLQQPDLPEGFRFRFYQDGDREKWPEFYTLSDQFSDLTPESFDQQFHQNYAALRERMIFVEDEDGGMVGTSAAWYDDADNDPAMGRVHWVAVHPEFRDRGLGKQLLRETLLQLTRLGHTKAHLITANMRLPAIDMYLRHGFVPEPRSAEENDAWRGVAENLRQELRATVLAALEK